MVAPYFGGKEADVKFLMSESKMCNNLAFQPIVYSEDGVRILRDEDDSY